MHGRRRRYACCQDSRKGFHHLPTCRAWLDRFLPYRESTSMLSHAFMVVRTFWPVCKNIKHLNLDSRSLQKTNPS